MISLMGVGVDRRSGCGIFPEANRLQVFIEAAGRAPLALVLAGDGEKTGNVVTVGGGKRVFDAPDFAEHLVAVSGGPIGISR